MLQFLYAILLNSAVFLIAFFSLRFYDKKSGKNTVSGLKMTYAISAAMAVFITNSGLDTYGIERNLSSILFTALVCMFPVSAIVNCGYAIAVFLRAIFEKVRKPKAEDIQEKESEKTVKILKSKRKKK